MSLHRAANYNGAAAERCYSSTWIDAANICPEMYLGTKKCSTIAAQKRARQPVVTVKLSSILLNEKKWRKLPMAK